MGILAVMGVHISALLIPSLYGRWFFGGVLGVNIFFVISGFLITALLLEENQRSGEISLLSFWRRRVLRLFPALYLLLVVQLVYTMHVHDPLSNTLKGDGLIIAYISNWAWANGWPQPFGLTHTWSLGVEEQFYVIWPILLIMLLRARRTWLVPAAALVIAIGSAVFRWHLSDNTSSWIRPLAETPAQLDSLMVGVAVGSALHMGWRPSRMMIRILTLPAVLYLAWAIQTGAPVLGLYHWVMPIAAVATAVLILAALEPEGFFYRIMVLPPVRWVGRLSYSLYLWHFFVFSWLLRSNHFPNDVERGGAGIVISLAAAMASYYLVERPCISLGHRYFARWLRPKGVRRLVEPVVAG